jgi:riboflavin synthase, alpha subunit
MFSGIIEAVGHVANIADHGGDKRITIDAGGLDLPEVNPGDSVAVNGVCLTVVSKSDGRFSADVSAETLSCTSFAELKVGSKVNLERSLRLSDRLQGHLVSGHVDGAGTVRDRTMESRSERLVIECPAGLLRYISKKGSICIDGVSLTVNEKLADGFTINIIPHTLAHTIIRDYRKGTRVNIEVDMLARYLESLIADT